MACQHFSSTSRNNHVPPHAIYGVVSWRAVRSKLTWDCKNCGDSFTDWKTQSSVLWPAEDFQRNTVWSVHGEYCFTAGFEITGKELRLGGNLHIGHFHMTPWWPNWLPKRKNSGYIDVQRTQYCHSSCRRRYACLLGIFRFDDIFITLDCNKAEIRELEFFYKTEFYPMRPTKFNYSALMEHFVSKIESLQSVVFVNISDISRRRIDTLCRRSRRPNKLDEIRQLCKARGRAELGTHSRRRRAVLWSLQGHCWRKRTFGLVWG